MAKAKDEFNFLDSKNKELIRKAYRAGKRTIELGGTKFNLERGRGKAGKPFILILPVRGMLPMGQVEVVNFGSTKLEHVKESLGRGKRR